MSKLTTYEKVSFDKLSEALAEHEKVPLRVKRDNVFYQLNNEGVTRTYDMSDQFYRKIEISQEELDAIELCKIRCKCFDKTFDWDSLGEKRKDMYREMSKRVTIKK